MALRANPLFLNGNVRPGSTVDHVHLDRGGIQSRVTYLSEPRIVVARFCGSLDTDAVWQRLEGICNEVGRHAVEGVLVDVCDGTFTACPADIHAFAAYLISFLGRRRLAFITRSVIQYGMARMIAADAAAHGASVKVFRDHLQADVWLQSTDIT